MGSRRTETRARFLRLRALALGLLLGPLAAGAAQDPTGEGLLLLVYPGQRAVNIDDAVFRLAADARIEDRRGGQRQPIDFARLAALRGVPVRFLLRHGPDGPVIEWLHLVDRLEREMHMMKVR